MQEQRGGQGGASAHERLLGLLEEPPERPDFRHGYLDLLDEGGPEAAGLAQRLMHTGFVPRVYERWWRPALFRVVKGPGGPSVAAEHRLARDWLALSPGDTVLDVACGPGNFTRGMAIAAGRTGLAVGLDASVTMLERAVSEGRGRLAAGAGQAAGGTGPVYVRADASHLPFRAASFDGVCCFAALPMFADPMGALDQMAAVLRPGGRIVLMASYARGGAVRSAAERLPGRMVGMRIFGSNELTGALQVRGFTGIRQHAAGLTQFVGGTRAGPGSRNAGGPRVPERGRAQGPGTRAGRGSRCAGGWAGDVGWWCGRSRFPWSG
ncbi:MAG TPA: methyltransferase domain-containing protein [Streptosporangiaceae bacterium]|jgi:SAM-dependent methyltransferase